MLQPLRTIPSPSSAWRSPALQDGLYLLQYWKLCGSERALGLDFTSQKQAVCNKLSPTVDIYQNTPDAPIQKQIRMAKANLFLLWKQSFELRQQHLEQRAEHYATQNDRHKETVLKQMKLAKYISQVYKKIKRYLKPSTKQSLHKVQTTSPDGTLTTHTNQPEMEDILLNHHKTHFHQASGTPFTLDPLSKFFGPTTNTDHSEAFRNGEVNTSCIPTSNKVVQDFIDILQPNPTDPLPIDTSLTLAQLQHGFQIWRESTSTPPQAENCLSTKYGSTNQGSKIKSSLDINFLLQSLISSLWHNSYKPPFTDGL